ncbi:uncharacterized protein [Antedon mediterranea]|uniref:uncharacterized protein n=1 Tax=Antedon mediterranea TaxID=105859 RepID=UPI003AF682B2
MAVLRFFCFALILSLCFGRAMTNETENIIKNIRALIYKALYDNVLEKTGGPNELNTLVLLDPSIPLNKEDIGHTPDPSTPPDLSEFNNLLPTKLLINNLNYKNAPIIQKNGVAQVYKKILDKMIVEKPKLNNIEQNRYNEAEILTNERVSGSVIGRTSNEDVTKLEVYRHFRSIYFNAKETKEKEIYEKKNTLSSMEYRNWYMYNYRKLKDNEKSALQDWVIKGYKKIISEALEIIDDVDEISILEIDDAKNEYEAAIYENENELSFKNIIKDKIKYDVEYSPTNWNDHLYDQIHAPTPTSSQYLNMIVDLKEYSIVLQAIANAHASDAVEAQDNINTDEATVKAQEDALVIQVAELIKQLDDCNELNMNCLSVDALAEKQKNDTLKWEENQTQLDEYKLILKNANSIKTAVDNLIIKIGDKIIKYEEDYENEKIIELETDNDLLNNHDFPEEEWETFYFNSQIELRNINNEIGRIAEFKPAKINKEFKEIIEKRGSKTLKLEIRMHYRGVGIYRPWFNEEIFKNDNIKLNDKTLVSPGYKDDLINELKKKTNNNNDKEDLYKFPLYPTGLLIAKDIKMKIRGLNEKVGKELIENSYNADQIGIDPPEIIADDNNDNDNNAIHHYGEIFGFTYNNRDTNAVRYRVRQDYNDVDIELLEPHIIGQYCDIMKKFPKK